MEIKKKKSGITSRRPSPEKLAELYEHMTASQIARMYHVKEATVRSWIYKLRKEKKDYAL